MDNIRKKELVGLNISELEDYMVSIGQPKFRGRQIYQWINCKEISSFWDMSDLPKDLRKILFDSAKVSIPRVLKQRVSVDGTRKFLMELEDKKKVETVIIPQNDNSQRFTICLSVQVGCPMGCAFCATGFSGFHRNMKAHEIVGQLLGSKKELKKRLKCNDSQIISNVVFMGMGEPMLNYEEMLKSIYIFNDHKGINIGQRHITISTAGDVEGIKRLAGENLQVTLAVSLHAATNQLRDKLIPLNRKYPLEVLMDAVKTYLEVTNRRVTFEYLMLDGVNINQSDADNLIRLVGPLKCNINLIPYNEVPELPFRKPLPGSVQQFYQYLVQGGLSVTLRGERGADIEAACGQLKMNN